VIKGDPDDLGLKPYGAITGSGPGGREVEKAVGDEAGDLGLKDAMRTHAFWLFVIVMFICGSGDFLILTHLIPFVTDYDISPMTAGNMLAWLGLMSLPGILIAGPLSDRIGNKVPIALTFVLRVLLFILILTYQNLISFYIFSLVFGFTLLVTAPLAPILSGKLFGFSHVGLISGFITTIHHMGGGLGGYLGGALFDRTGSYHPVFLLSTVLALLAVFLTMMIKEERHPGPS
jgi:predicted MFS family arabinose efflux permease